MQEEIKILLKKYKAILNCSHEQFANELSEILVNNITENHTITLKPFKKLLN